MKKVLTSLLLASSVSFAANVSFDYDQWAADLQTLIELDKKADQTIKGSDINNNMVRDDIENYIKEKFSGDNFQTVMFLEAAKTIQKILLLPKNTPKKIHKELDNRLLQIYTCRDYILYKDSKIDINKELKEKALFKSKVLNTDARMQKYIEHKRSLPQKYSIPSDKILKSQQKACEKLFTQITHGVESSTFSLK